MSGTRGDCARADGTADANRENASYHYAASNAFYALFLDPAMVYSCGYFTDWDNNLAAAQYDKLETICRELRLRPDEKLPDIGYGWGALVCRAAQHLAADAFDEPRGVARERDPRGVVGRDE